MVNDASLVFAECWSVLATLKSGSLPQDETRTLLGFQPKLATALSNLSETYRQLVAEKDARVAAKALLSSGWFARRMKFLASQQDVIRHAILIGKSIGDGFAWFFYQNNRQFLAEHLKQPEQLLIPSGAGGAAEVELTKQLPVFAGQFVLYHGITSILRLGDCSLIQLDPLAVSMIGELKAGKPQDGKLQAVLLFPVNPTDIKVTKLSASESVPVQRESSAVLAGLTPSARARLSRQMKTLLSSHQKLSASPDQRLNLEVEDNIAELDEFIANIRPGRASFANMGKSLLLVGLQLREDQLYGRLNSRQVSQLQKRLNGLESAVMSLMRENDPNNALIVGSWFYRKDGDISHRPGMTHPIWWPLKAVALRRVLFQEVIVMTVLNPAYLVDALRAEGYDVEMEGTQIVSAEKRVGKGRASLHGVAHYLELIQHYLFSEAHVVGFLRKVEFQLSSMPVDGIAQIDLQIEQHFGTPPA